MANYYTHVAFKFVASVEEAAQFKALSDLDFDEPENEELRARIFSQPEEVWGTTYKVEIEDDGTTVYVADDAGETQLEVLAELIKFACPTALPVGFEWASTCSKATPGGFGGGVCVIHRDHIEWENTNTRLAQLMGDKG